MPRILNYVFAGLLIGLIVGVPLAYSYHRHTTLRQFRVVEEGILYRSGQLTLPGLKRLIHDHGIKTVVTFRDADRPDQPPPDLAEEQYCRKQELNYHRITPRAWWGSDGSVPARIGVRQFLKVMRDPANYPVLMHCFAGVHRTGAHCAIYRMEFHRWDNEKAIAELVANGYDNLTDEVDLLTFLEQYRPSWQDAETNSERQ